VQGRTEIPGTDELDDGERPIRVFAGELCRLKRVQKMEVLTAVAATITGLIVMSQN
jgi:hypothetical protein